MKIGIIGTRGIPNKYGGFEQFAEHFAVRMVARGHDVTVYTSHMHPYTQKHYKNVKLMRCYDPEYLLGTTGQFIYDFNCIRNSHKQHFDIILQLGYTSSTIWSWLFPKSAVLVTNMDGLEWSRAKYSKPVQHFLRYAEKWGVHSSDHLIADSKGIQEYLLEKYDANSEMIAYGADLYETNDVDYRILRKYYVSPNDYDLLIARFEPENNVEIALRAYAAQTSRKLLLIGNYNGTAYGRRLYKEYGEYSHIHFAGPVYNIKHLNELRYHARLYIHGHSVGGTNPSLLEAMGCNSIICAHDNIFNRYVLGKDAFYFNASNDLLSIIAGPVTKEKYQSWQYNNKEKILNEYNWDIITGKIEACFKQWMKYGEKQEQALYTV